MTKNPNRRSLIVIISVISTVVSLTYLLSILARGYQPDFNNGFRLKATGILSATSKPKSASVYVNNHLVTATDDTINLSPGDYHIKIAKDGFFPWSKDYKIQKELVYQTEAILFRSPPETKTIFNFPIYNPVISQDKTKLVFATATASAEKEVGLYLLENFSLPIPIGKIAPKLILRSSPSVNWSQFNFIFSPNSHQIIATSKKKTTNFLINLDQLSDPSHLPSPISDPSIITKDWQEQQKQADTSKIEKLPTILLPFVATNSVQVYFSDNNEKILYLSANSGNLEPNLSITPQQNPSQKQSRNLIKDHYYVYDPLNDTNFEIGPVNSISNPSWLTNSDNIVFITPKNEINTVESDNTNLLTLYRDNSKINSFMPWSDGTKLIITNSALQSINIR